MRLDRRLSINELNQPIKKIKNGKTVPESDNIPDASFIKNEGNTMREILFNLFDSVMFTEDTPERWNTGVISSLYKGRGDREDMINMRGINVSSNVGKIFERIINNRVIKVLLFTEAQAGGRKEYSTVDQLFILKPIIRKSVFQKTSIYYVLRRREGL